MVVPVLARDLGESSVLSAPYWIVTSGRSAREDYKRSEDSDEEYSGLKDSVNKLLFI